MLIGVDSGGITPLARTLFARATGFDGDEPIIGLSWADLGSGVVALFLVALIFSRLSAPYK
jgi:hypothetical protein